MTNDWRIETDFTQAWGNAQKRMMRQERRPTINNATQILGPGAGPFAVLLNDWNAEEAVFNGIFYSGPGAINVPPEDPPLPDPDDPTTYYWMGETFGYADEDTNYRWGFQRLTRVHHPDDIVPGDPPVDWLEYRRRFYPQGELVVYTAWEVV